MENNFEKRTYKVADEVKDIQIAHDRENNHERIQTEK